MDIKEIVTWRLGTSEKIQSREDLLSEFLKLVEHISEREDSANLETLHLARIYEYIDKSFRKGLHKLQKEQSCINWVKLAASKDKRHGCIYETIHVQNECMIATDGRRIHAVKGVSFPDGDYDLQMNIRNDWDYPNSIDLLDFKQLTKIGQFHSKDVFVDDYLGDIRNDTIRGRCLPGKIIHEGKGFCDIANFHFFREAMLMSEGPIDLCIYNDSYDNYYLRNQKQNAVAVIHANRVNKMAHIKRPLDSRRIDILPMNELRGTLAIER